jgi:asparagine synthase (glutamine-hydrolysing)
MCGIAGLVATATDRTLERRLDAMLATQAHRGPDGRGTAQHVVADHAVALGHGRLAILDLSNAGAQPMVSADGRHVLIFNGEVYNYRELADELAARGSRFHGRSDTEVVLEALRVFGDAAFARFNGMWAIAWLDRQAQRLVLCRDRFGIKPLYLAEDEGRLVFASELKTILAASDRRWAVSTRAVTRYLDQSLLAAEPTTFFEGIRALPQGTVLTIDLSSPARSTTTRVFWSAPDVELGPSDLTRTTNTIRELFTDAVRLRLRSDVPVGVLLSGGVDSSAIAAAMHRILGPAADLHLISAVSDDPRFDESEHIDRMTAHLGRPCHKVKLDFDAETAFGLLDEVTWSNDEPVVGFSSVAHYLLMRRARELGVTVVLSGQGADELLCGYRKYLGFHLQDLIGKRKYAAAARTLAAFVSNGTLAAEFALGDAKRYLPKRLVPAIPDARGVALRAASHAPLPLGLGARGLIVRQREDLYRYSVPALVHYEDRMSMASGREIRLPFLDYRLVEALLPLPASLKLRDGWTKWIFRKAIEGDVPAEIAWRKDKKGFSNPQSEWLRGPLRRRVEEIFTGEMHAAQLGLLDPAALRRRLDLYVRGSAKVAFKDVFYPLALEIWTRRFGRWLAPPPAAAAE